LAFSATADVHLAIPHRQKDGDDVPQTQVK